jgi:hypothetical protein
MPLDGYLRSWRGVRSDSFEGEGAFQTRIPGKGEPVSRTILILSPSTLLMPPVF